MSSCSGLRVQLISESTVDAGLWLAVVEVDVHPGVAEGAATTIARHLEMTKLGNVSSSKGYLVVTVLVG